MSWFTLQGQRSSAEVELNRPGCPIKYSIHCSTESPGPKFIELHVRLERSFFGPSLILDPFNVRDRHLGADISSRPAMAKVTPSHN